MPDPSETPTLAEAHVALTRLWLLASGHDLAGRRLRAEFVRAVEPNAAELRRSLGVTYDVARAIAAGRPLQADEADALARLLHTKWARQNEARLALESAAAKAADEAETPPAEVSAVS